MRGVLLDVVKGEIKEVNIEDSLEAYYDALNCTVIDIVQRDIGGITFDIVCDDEGLLKDSPVVSAVDSKYRPMFVGNLLFLHGDDTTGEMVGISEEEASFLIGNCCWSVRDTTVYPVMMDCEYY